MASRTNPTDDDSLEQRLQVKMQEAERKAWDSLARYKFLMFGYWSSAWVNLNRLSARSRPNPFRSLVRLARTEHTDGTASDHREDGP